ncbi:GspE/PulE family protein [Anaerobaca lacustris]|uniref:GspE/PulE family protein n=1 Tax=Anaerobaca lacustris TaxID=3044600 RepID=A0AAW6TYF6_9BACT|nr:GspE/PulE family protein [Sedimentisphaerales bacterium M17dextr]
MAPKTHDRRQHNGLDVVALVDDLLAQAIQAEASDVHFEPTADSLVVKFRLDGVLNPVEGLPATLTDNVVARLKVLGGLLTYRNDIPQEGRLEISGAAAEKVSDVRLAIFPTIHGQRAVVRLFYRRQDLLALEQLGFSPQIERALKAVAAQSQGVLLLTGPAGSGKSTTLAAILRHIIRTLPGKSIVSLEDPVEIRIDGVTQVPITPHGQMTFPTALRSLLRQDPQVLMIGEIRDAETARIAIEAGLTGHMLMSTMHSGTPAGALLRLLEMGIEPYQVTSSIAAVVNQRLVRRLCERCKRQAAGEYEPVGCDACLGTGFKGRLLIAEMVQLDSDLRKAILAKADLEELDTLLQTKGHATILEDGRRLVETGVTTQAELNRACGLSDGAAP